MKKTVLSIFSLGIITLFLTSSSGGRTDGRSGSPGDANQDCGQCHGGSSASSVSMIETDIPTSGYIGGTTYNLTVTVAETGATRFGFQITAEHSSNAKAGTFATGGNTEIYTSNSDQLATQNNAGIFGTDSKSYTMEWTAPTAGAGDVTFYVAGNAANGDGGTGGDIIYTDSEAIAEDNSGATGIEENNNINSISVYPNPTTGSFKIAGLEASAETAISITDTKGAIVKKMTITNNLVDVSDLDRGLYFISVENNSISFVDQLIIQ